MCYFIAHNALLQVIYEKNKDENLAAPLWRYRSRITIEHLEFFIEQQSKSENECAVLKEFLKEVNNNCMFATITLLSCAI